jgi:flagellar hook-associated protein 2
MGTINLPGLFTGIDTNQIIAQLMEIQKRTLNLYQKRQATWNDRNDALSTLENKLSALRTSVRALSDAQKLRAFKTASSDTDILTAEAAYNAFEGNHSIEINQLANAERWVHTTGVKYKEDYVGEGVAGTFIYSYNHEEATLTTTATTTLEDLVGLINNDANNPGVTAGLLYYNDAYHLVLSGNDAGTDYQISVNPSNTEVWKSGSPFLINGENATLSTKITDLDLFTGTLAEGDHITISGLKHDGTAVNVDYSINANTKLSHIISEINDAFGDTATATLVNGEIRLTDNTSGESLMELALTYDPPETFNIPAISRITEGGSTPANLTGFASADFTETQSAQDSRIRVDGYPSGDWISKSSNTIDDVINGVTLHLHDTGTAQVNLTRDIDLVKDKLNAMIKAYNEAVTYIKEKTGYNSTLKTGGILMGDYVVSTIKSQFRSPLIAQTSGFLQDIDTFLNPSQIGLKLDSDGLLSLDTNAFNEAISKDYLGTLAIIGADKTGSSTSNTVKFYGASSKYTTAGEYDVEVVVDDEGGNHIESARIKLSSEGESAWRDATFDGNIVTGNLTFNSNGNPIYPENALQLSVDLTTADTFTATVRVKQGFTGAIEDALDRMLKTTTGSIQIDQASAEDTIKGLQDKIDAEQVRLTQRQERLVAQYARLEKMLAVIQGQMSAFGMI